MWKSSWYIGKLFGISLYLHMSWFLIFFLVTLDLALGVFPSLHPEWSALFTWVLAGVAAILFFVSILAHELAHSLVAKKKGIAIDRITLFLFGGVANMEHEPPTPRTEFFMAAAGPLTSLVIGVVCLLFAGYLPGTFPAGVQDPLIVLQFLSPLALTLMWLGTVNIFVGIFNLVPGFPLDGGRIVRSFLWALTGNIQRATVYASWLGRGVAISFMAIGFLMAVGFVFPVLGTGIFSGLWLIFIGWFLYVIARASYRDTVIDSLLSGLRVEDVMRAGYVSVGAQVSVQELYELHLKHNQTELFMVLEKGETVGCIRYQDIVGMDTKERQKHVAADIMKPIEHVERVAPGDRVVTAYRKLSQRQLQQLPVVDTRGILGMIQLSDIVHWLHQEKRSVRSFG